MRRQSRILLGVMARDHDRRDVADRILVAEQPGDDHQQQHAARERARNGGERSDQTTLGLPIDMPGEKPDLSFSGHASAGLGGAANG
jgi:hypothetical protein